MSIGENNHDVGTFHEIFNRDINKDVPGISFEWQDRIKPRNGKLNINEHQWTNQAEVKKPDINKQEQLEYLKVIMGHKPASVKYNTSAP